MKTEQIRGYVDQLCKEFGTNDPEEILSGLGVSVVIVEKESPLLHGSPAVFVPMQNAGVIYLSRDVREIEKPFIVGHELGHVVLHSDALCSSIRLPNRARMEEEADAFSAFLMQKRYDEPEDGEASPLEYIRESATVYWYR